MYKKLILMLTCGMLVVSLAGCGKNNQGSAEVNEESAVDNSAADSANASVDSVKLPELNLEEEFVYEPAMLACSLPKDFKQDSSEEGMWVHKSYPTDLSTITYDISDSSEELKGMSQDMYKSLMEEDFLNTYGDEVTINISSYDNIVIDHRNGFKIMMSYEFKNIEYEQLTYILFNGDELHNLTFSQEKDKGWMDDFEACAETIHFVKTGN